MLLRVNTLIDPFEFEIESLKTLRTSRGCLATKVYDQRLKPESPRRQVDAPYLVFPYCYTNPTAALCNETMTTKWAVCVYFLMSPFSAVAWEFTTNQEEITSQTLLRCARMPA